MTIHESAEDYLEAILVIKQTKGAVRSIDIAHHMNFSKPSVSRAMGLLRDNGYITVDREGWISLTDSGMAIASKIYERHRCLTDWFIALGVDPAVAAEDACRVEHDLSEQTFAKMKEHIEQEHPDHAATVIMQSEAAGTDPA